MLNTNYMYGAYDPYFMASMSQLPMMMYQTPFQNQNLFNYYYPLETKATEESVLKSKGFWALVAIGTAVLLRKKIPGYKKFAEWLGFKATKTPVVTPPVVKERIKTSATRATKTAEKATQPKKHWWQKLFAKKEKPIVNKGTQVYQQEVNNAEPYWEEAMGEVMEKVKPTVPTVAQPVKPSFWSRVKTGIKGFFTPNKSKQLAKAIETESKTIKSDVKTIDKIIAKEAPSAHIQTVTPEVKKNAWQILPETQKPVTSVKPTIAEIQKQVEQNTKEYQKIMSKKPVFGTNVKLSTSVPVVSKVTETTVPAVAQPVKQSFWSKLKSGIKSFFTPKAKPNTTTILPEVQKPATTVKPTIAEIQKQVEQNTKEYQEIMSKKPVFGTNVKLSTSVPVVSKVTETTVPAVAQPVKQSFWSKVKSGIKSFFTPKAKPNTTTILPEIQNATHSQDLQRIQELRTQLKKANNFVHHHSGTPEKCYNTRKNIIKPLQEELEGLLKKYPEQRHIK